jgi:predicted TIM-barrel fold metal-dependent hydrolase
MRRKFLGVALALLVQALVSAQTRPAGQSADAKTAGAISPYIDAHTHFDEHNPEGAVRAALEGVSRQNLAKLYLMIPPDTFDHPGHYDAELILNIAKKHPQKLAVIAGGGSLNAMIQESVRTGNAGPEVKRKFKEKAEALLREGVVGFGEMTAEHFPSGTPYQYAPADHPLFLLLADIAAEHGVPINIHMEAVTKEMPPPPGVKSPPAPPQLQENIAAFKRLLSHNPRANIIWAHLGGDRTGHRTLDLSRRLLQEHPNLYLEVKLDPLRPGPNYPLERADGGKIKADWLKLFQDFPDRFIIGSDQHYDAEPSKELQRWQMSVILLNQLPMDLRQKIGMQTAQRLYSGTARSGGSSR